MYVFKVGERQEGVSAEDETAAEARYLRELPMQYGIKEFETKEGHNDSNQVGRWMESPRRQRPREFIAMMCRMAQSI